MSLANPSAWASVPLAQAKPLWLGLLVLAPLALWFFRRRGDTPGWAVPLTVVAVVVGALLGSGLVEIPSLEDLPLQRYVEDVGDAVGRWAYLLVGLLAFLETGAFVGLVAPGETFVILGGVLAGEGTLGYGSLLAVVWACAFLGDVASFGLGRRLGRSFLERHGPKVKITPDRLQHVEGFLERHGGKAIVIGRFIGFVRAVAPFILGSSGVGWRRFIPYAVVGSGLWSALFVTLGYLFWRSLDRLLGWVKQGAFAFGVAVVVVVAIVAAIHWLGEEEHRRQVGEFFDRLGRTRGGRLAIAAWRPFSGPARFFWHRITPGGIGLEVTTLVAVAAVGAFAFLGIESFLDDGTPATTTTYDRETLRWADRLSWGPTETLGRVGVVLGSAPVVGGAALLAALFLWVRRRRVGTATALVVAVGLTLGVAGLIHGGEGRTPPATALLEVSGSSFPSLTAAGAAVWVAIAVALSPSVRRIPGRIGLTGLAVILGILLCFAPIVLRTGYVSDVLAGAGLSAALLALCGIVAIVVGHIRHTPGA
jgi:undecaprenyl-diphosphatase